MAHVTPDRPDAGPPARGPRPGGGPRPPRGPQKAGPAAERPGLGARRVAFTAVAEVIRRGASLDDVLGRPSGLEPRDDALARAIRRHVGHARSRALKRAAMTRPSLTARSRNATSA
jgi:hypothetical protein